MWKREIAPISPLFNNTLNRDGTKLHIHLLNVVVRFIVVLSSAELIRRGTDISKCSRKFLGICDNENRLYFMKLHINYTVSNNRLSLSENLVRVLNMEI